MSSPDIHPPSTGDSASESGAASTGFRFPLRFDPVRILAGVLSRWPWIVLGMLVLGTAGAVAGHYLNQPSYSLSVALIKQRVPQTVQTSEIGQSFRPTDLNDATLLATLLAIEPRDLAFERADNGIAPSHGGSLVEASQLENTDIFYITYHSPISPEDALKVCGIWAEEIIDYTKRLQQSEARSVLGILAKEVEGLETRIDAVNKELLEFARSSQFVGGESQVAAVLGKLSQIELGLDSAKASEKALQDQLDELKEKIRHHSPLELRLRAEQEELAKLRSTYTDDNPLVQAKLEGIRYIEDQLKRLGDGREAELESFTGTPLGNQLYLDIIDIRNRISEARNRIEALETQRETTASRLAEFPGIITRYDALRARRDSHLSQLSLMSKRLKEAEIFASGSPGYWQMFQPPDSRQVVPSSGLKKPALLGMAGAGGGAVIAILLTLLMTQRTTRRSVLECCACTGAPLRAIVPSGPSAPSASTDLWLTLLSPTAPGGDRPTLLWTAGLGAAQERHFWETLALAAEEDGGKPLQISDLTPDGLWGEESHPSSLVWQPGTTGADILRASSLPAGEDRMNLSTACRWFAVVRGDKDSLKSYDHCRRHAEVYLESCDGTIALMEPPVGRFRTWADHLSTFLARKFS